GAHGRGPRDLRAPARDPQRRRPPARAVRSAGAALPRQLSPGAVPHRAGQHGDESRVAQGPRGAPRGDVTMTAGDRLRDLVRGCTFDDFLLTPQESVLERRDPTRIDLASRLSAHIVLKRPIVSANMDTVTRAPMAIVQAEEGGIGIVDRGFRDGDIDPQV